MNIDEIRARAEAAKAETNVFHRTKPLMPEDLELSLADDGYNPCLLRIMAHALFDIPALLDALEAKERELAAAVSDLTQMATCKLSGDCSFCKHRLIVPDMRYKPCKGCERPNRSKSNFEWRGAGKEQNDG